MKIWFTLALSLSATLALAHEVAPLHLDLEMESVEHSQMLKTLKRKNADDPAIAKGLLWGQRLAAWLASENNRRAPSEQLRLTSPQTRRGVPIDKPSIYSEKTIAADLEKFTTELNPAIIAVMNGAAFPATLPLPDDEFIVQARKIDKTYQSSARFKGLIGYRFQYAQRKVLDVRPFYFFKTNKWTAERINGIANLPADEAANVRAQLAGMCLNGGQGLDVCKKKVANFEAAGKLGEMFTAAYAKSSQVWDGFFAIPSYGTRSDVVFNTASVMTVPFNTPSIAKFGPYLKDNVEDEWKWTGWNLKVAYGTYPNGPELTFQTGVVPHVNGLGGNQIVMDSTQPIEEYESQWTIRHEFGHVIGFPDCYHEFYDEELKAFVNYQLDITDLMCSRAGNMTERLYKDLVRVYKK